MAQVGHTANSSQFFAPALSAFPLRFLWEEDRTGEGGRTRRHGSMVQQGFVRCRQAKYSRTSLGSSASRGGCISQIYV